ncbi:hypothetical protein [Pelagibius sp.]|uniref:hypothetical protein n=1 Tax=Pelagibius sp. TaxID=1931238 RepID=UPI002622EC8A|nr:hypothetical protein [Pelagibius sp.]
MSDDDRTNDATTTIRSFWLPLKNAFVVVLSNLPYLAWLAAVPFALMVTIGAVTAVLYPHIFTLLSRWIGYEFAVMLNIGGLKATIDLILFLVPVSMFVIAWIQFVTIGSACDFRTIVRSQAFRRVLCLSPLLCIYPIVTFLNSVYVSYEFAFASVDAPGFGLLPIWAYGLIVGLGLEAFVLGRLGPTLVTTALGGQALTRPTWQHILRNGLGWLLTYRAIGILFAIFYWPFAYLTVISDTAFVHLRYGSAAIEDWLLRELIHMPATIGSFLNLALGLAFIAAVTKTERQKNLGVFD